MDSFGSGYLSLHSILVQIYVPMYISSALCAHSSTMKSAYTTNLTSSTRAVDVSRTLIKGTGIDKEGQYEDTRDNLPSSRL